MFSVTREKKVLNSLISVCRMALDVESGSVMTVDKYDHLRVTASFELNKDIADITYQKIGEGIAGMAAETSETIILPKDHGKKGVCNAMKRNDIKSSMIMPFNKADSREVYGVLNLNIMRKNREFSRKDISLAKELVNLASIALFA
ncbi:MAG: GAF domain-containing protein [Candidatus Omnitrophica bacterium]|nr:GAF domain-containing protein [Candidatus Omnitrophota bacterium]